MKGKQQVRKAARDLLRDPQFLFHAGQQIGAAGVVGEDRSRLLIYLACLTCALEKPISILVKGPTSTGKNNLVKAVLSLVPEESVVTRSSFSNKALAHGATTLAKKIVYTAEHRGGKNGEFFRRLLQSEGELHHEATVVTGAKRGTEVASCVGDPVFVSTTTDEKVYPDDETRFLSVQADESVEQTRDVVRAQFSEEKQEEPVQAAVWHEAFRLLTKKVPTFRHPSWFGYLGERIPASQSRARRDVPRFLSLLKAVALCRSYSDGRRDEGREHIEISFADYCVAYLILSDAFSSTYSGAHPQSLQIAGCVRELHGIHERHVTVKEIRKALRWKDQVTYRWLKDAEKKGLVVKEPGTREKNLKRYGPGALRPTRFLPDPQTLLMECAELDEVVRYEDPLTGDKKMLQGDSARGNRQEGKRKQKAE